MLEFDIAEKYGPNFCEAKNCNYPAEWVVDFEDSEDPLAGGPGNRNYTMYFCNNHLPDRARP